MKKKGNEEAAMMITNSLLWQVKIDTFIQIGNVGLLQRSQIVVVV